MRFVKYVLLLLAAASVGWGGGCGLALVMCVPFMASHDDIGPGIVAVFAANVGAVGATVAMIGWLIGTSTIHRWEPRRRLHWNAGSWAGVVYGLVTSGSVVLGGFAIMGLHKEKYVYVFVVVASVLGVAFAGALGTLLDWACRKQRSSND